MEPQRIDRDEARVSALRRVLMDEETWPLGMRSRIEARLARSERRERKPSHSFLAVAGTLTFTGASALQGFDEGSVATLLCLAVVAVLYSTGMRLLAARGDVD